MKIVPINLLFIFLVSCSSVESDKGLTPLLDNIPEKWKKDYANDYGIEQIWPIKSDSSFYYLLDDFNSKNEEILLLDLKKEISSAHHNISKSLLFPELSLNMSIDKSQQNSSSLPFDLSEDAPIEFDNLIDSESLQSTRGSLSFNTKWEIDLWGRIRDSKKSSFYSMKSNSYDIVYAKASLRGQFIKLYLSVVELQNQIEISDRNLSSLASIKDILEERVLNGISTSNEAYIASANYYLYLSNLASLKYNYESLVRNVDLILGRYLTNDEKINFEYPSENIEVQDTIFSNLLERRPDVLSAKAKILAANSKLKSDKKVFFPNIQILGSLGPLSKLEEASDLNNLINEDFLTWSMGLNILEPIFQGGKIKNNIKISEYELKASELEYIKIAINSIYEADNLLTKDITLRDAHIKILQSKTDIEKAVKYAQSSYDLGLVDLMYLLNAQQQLHNISLQENKILSDRYKNKIDLILSLGGRLDYE